MRAEREALKTKKAKGPLVPKPLEPWKGLETMTMT